MPVETDVAKFHDGDTVTLAQLNKGYELYLSSCSGCHTLHVPASHTRQQWERLLPEMLKDAKLDSMQGRLVRNYILSKL